MTRPASRRPSDATQGRAKTFRLRLEELEDRDVPATTLVSAADPPLQVDDFYFSDAGSPGGMSANGRYAVFASTASNLVPGDTNFDWDVFVRDLQSGTTTRVSVASDGTEADSQSYFPSISADGRYVTFYSGSSNLVPGTIQAGIYIRDIHAGTTARVSVGPGGVQGNGISYFSSISANGRYVAFTSDADNLVAGDTNGLSDVFVRDIQSGTTTRVSLSSSGSQRNGTPGFGLFEAPSISADGRYVAFASDANNLVTGDTNDYSDVFVRDLQTGTTTRVSVGSGGLEADQHSLSPSISPDGRYVAFTSETTNFVAPGPNYFTFNVYVRDRQAGTTTLASGGLDGLQGNANSSSPSVSADGRYVAYESRASNLVAGDTNGASDMFVSDLQTGTTTRMSVGPGGVQGNGNPNELNLRQASISADGRHVLFGSDASNLAPGDTNSWTDVFVRSVMASEAGLAIGGAGVDVGRAVATDPAGNVYVTGHFHDTVDFDPSSAVFNLTSAGGLDAYVAKYTAAGALVWAKRLGGTAAGGDASFGVGLDAAGNVFVAGHFTGTADFNPSPTATFNLTSAGGQDVYVCKLDGAGNFLWAKRLGGSAAESCTGMAVDGQGNLLFAGAFQGTVDFDPSGGAFKLTASGTIDAYVCKLDGNGNFVWANRFGGELVVAPGRLATDEDGNVLATGYFSGEADFDPGVGVSRLTSAGGTDVFVSKLDAGGNFLWAKKMGGTSDESGSGVAVDQQGNVYATGEFKGTSDFDPGAGAFNLTSSGDNDAFVNKLDPAGNFLWARRMGGTLDDRGYGVTTDGVGNAWIIGHFQDTADFDPSTGIFTLTSAGSFDVFVSKLDSSGNFVLAARQGGGTKDDYGIGITVDAQGVIHSIGNFTGAGDFDPTAEVNNLYGVGASDAFVSKFIPTSVTGRVWEDRDADGVRDADEPARAGVMVELLDKSGTTSLGVRMTGGDGAYEFLAPSESFTEYVVQFRPPTGFAFCGQDLGGDDTRDSDANTVGRTAAFSLAFGETAVKDAGLTGSLPVFGFATAAGGSGTDEGRSVVTDSDGNILVTGFFSGTADFDPSPGISNLTSVSGMDAYVAKYTSLGALIWVRQLGSAAGGYGNLIATDGLGNVYSTADGAVNKLDLNGKLLWTKRFGGGANGVGVDAERNVYATGAFNGTADFNPGSGVFNMTSVGGADAFVAKLDANGNFVWARQLGGAEEVVGYGLAVDVQGNVLTNGQFLGTADFDPGNGSFPLTSAGTFDVFVSKLDSSGNFVWARRMGGTNEDRAYGLATDGEGNVLTSGYFYDTADFDPGAGVFNLTSSGADVFVSKLDASGNFVWAKQLGGSSYEVSFGLATDAQGNVHTTGAFSQTGDFDPGPGVYNLTSAGTNDIFVSELDADGQFIRARRLGGAGEDFGYGVAADSQGNVYSAGFFAGSGDFDPSTGVYTVTGNGGASDAIITKLTLGTLTGRVWDDLDGDGVQDNGEPSVAGAVVELLDPGTLSLGEQVTGPDGTYSFTVPADNASGYILQFRPPSGRGFAGQDQGGNDGSDSDVSPVTGKALGVPLVGGGTTRRDAGLTGTAPAFGFALQAGGAESDQGDAVAVDAAGNVYTAGRFSGTADFDPGPGIISLTSVGIKDAFVAKYSPVGALIWAKSFGGSLDDEAQSVAATGDGGVVFTGYFFNTIDLDPSSGTFPVTSAGSYDTFVGKLNADGDFVWGGRIGGTATDVGRDIVTDAAGNVYLTGDFNNTADFNPDPDVQANMTSNGLDDTFVVKLDNAGRYVWARRFGGAGDELGSVLALDAVGNVYAGGSFAGTVSPVGGLPVLTSAGSDDAFVSKLTPAGVFVWSKRFGGPASDIVRGLAVDADGNVYATGYFADTADFDPDSAAPAADRLRTSAGSFDGYVSKLNSDGQFVWATRTGGPGDDIAIVGVVADVRGGVHMTGSFIGTVDFDPGTDTVARSSVAGTYDTFVRELDSAGNFVRVRQFGGPEDQEGIDIAADHRGFVYAIGHFTGTADFDPSDAGVYPLSNPAGGSNDVFLAQLAVADVAGAVWDDQDGDGVRDVGESGLSGATVELIDPVDGIVGNGNDLVVETQITGADGSYDFADPALGTRYLRINPPAGTSGDSQTYREITSANADLDGFGRSSVFNLRNAPVQLFDAGFRTIPNTIPAWGVGSAGADAARGVVTDAAGNTYVVGSFSGTADFDRAGGVTNLTSAGLEDGFVAKYDLDGALIWARPMGGVGADQTTGVAVDAAGNVFVTGTKTGSATFGGITPADLGGTDAFVAKLDASGTFLWAKELGGSLDDTGVGVGVDVQNNVHVTGTFVGGATFGGTTFTNNFGTDSFVVKLTTAGALTGTPLQFGGETAGTSVRVSGIAVGTGGVFLAGSFTGAADFDPTAQTRTLTRNGDEDAFAVRIKADGSFGWAHRFGSPLVENDSARGITLDSQGNVLFTGNFHGTVDFDPAPLGAVANLNGTGSTSDAYVCKLTADGGYLWAKQLGGTGEDSGTAVAVDARGYVYVTGDFTGQGDFDTGDSSVFNLAAAGGTDVFHAKLESDGNFLTAGQLGGTGADAAGGIAVAGAGDVRVVGSFAGLADLDPTFGSYGLTAAGGTDAFISQFPEFVIKGRVWEDLNANGLQDPGEPELTNATVELIDTIDGLPGNGDDVVIRTVTSAGGGYEFIDPPESFGYVVRVTTTVPTSPESRRVCLVSAPGQGGVNSPVDSDLNAAGESPVVRRSQGAVANLGAGFREKPLVTGGWGIGGTGREEGLAVTTDSAGNTYVAGTFSGTVDFDPRQAVQSRSSEGDADGFVAKYGPDGNLLWVRRLGGAAADQATAITLDPGGNVLVTGLFAVNASFEGTTKRLTARVPPGAPNAGSDVFVLKLSPQGDFQWVRALGGSYRETVAGIAADKDGNVFTAGTFLGTADFDPADNKVFNLINAVKTPPAVAPTRDIFVSKLNKDGNFVWAKKIGNTGDDEVVGLGLDSAGNFYATGRFANTVDFNPGTPVGNLTGGGEFVNSLDNAGNHRWAKKYDSTDVAGLAVAGGGVHTVGSALRKLDLDGNEVWKKPLNGDHRAVAADASGKVFTTGSFVGTVDFDPGSGTRTLTSAGTDAFVTGFDPAGELMYAHALGGTAADEGRALAAGSAGGVRVTGSFQATADFDLTAGTRNITAAGDADAFVWTIPGGGVRGYVWNDTDANGLREPSEPAVGGAVVRLWRAVNGIDPAVGPGDDTLIGTQITAADGSYRFEGTPTGPGYYIRVQPPVVTGLVFTPPNQGGNDDLDSDLTTSGVSGLFTIDPAVPTLLDAGIGGEIPPFGVAWATAGSGISTAFANTADALGNVYVTGEFKGTVDFDPGSGVTSLFSLGNSNNAFAAKYTAGGILVWAKAFRGTGDIGGQGIAVDAAGFVHVTGRFQGTADFGTGGAASALVSKGGYDAFVTTLDSSGAFVRTGQLGGPDNDYGNGIAAGNGRTYVTGSFQGTADFDPGAGTQSLASFGAQDAFVSVLTGEGAFVWVRQAGGNGDDDVGHGIATDAAGAVYVAGSFSKTADFDPGATVLAQTSVGLRDAFVWKLDKDGNIGTTGWAAQAGGPLNDEGNAVAVGPDGRVFAAGSFTGTADFDRGPALLEATSQGSTDAFVWAILPTGRPDWAKGLGGTDSDAGNAVAADRDGVYVAGSFVAFPQPADFDPGAGRISLFSDSGSSDAFVAKLDPSGRRQWAHRLGGQNDDAGLGIAVDPSGQVVFSGGLSGQGTYDPGDGDQTITGGVSANSFFGRVSQELAGGVFPLDAFEPNNTPASATDLGVVNVQQALDGPSLSSSSDEDWFRFELLSDSEAGNRVRIDVTARLDLYHPGEAEPFRTSESGELGLAGLTPDAYLIRVSGAASPAYQLTLDVPKGYPEDVNEPNDGFASPTELGSPVVRTSYGGLSVSSAGNEDWFAFTIVDGTAASEARIDFRHAQGDLELELFDAGGLPLRASAGLDDSESVSLAGLPAGRYLVRVAGHDGAINPSYALTLRPPKPLQGDIREPNNLSSSATNLGEIHGLASWKDLSIHAGADQDWFKIKLTAAGQAGHYAAIDFIHAEGDLDLRLYDSTGVTPLDASTGNGDTEQISLQGRPAGEYLLKVSGFAGATQPEYVLRTSAPVGTTEKDYLEGTAGNQTRPKASIVQTPGRTDLSGSRALVDLTLTVTPGPSGSSVTDEDWFRFTTTDKASARHNIVMNYPAANGTLGLELYNAAGKKIGTATGADGNLVASLKGLAKGTYFARTFIPKNGSAGSSYQLTFDAPASVPTDDWTVMVYMSADTLAERAFNDINEMEAAVAGLPGSVNIAVMWDQSANRTIYPTGNGTQKAWATAGRALIAPDTSPERVATKFEIMPEKDTGDPDTLNEFVTWARANAPADRYALIFWDHGAGLRGFNFDTQDGQTPDHLTTTEVAEALAGQPRLDLIAFDSCYMAVTEVAYNLRDNARVIVASQDAIPGDGFEYDQALAALQTDNPGGVTAEALATGFVKSHQTRYGINGREDTLSAVSTELLDELATALGVFAQAAAGTSVDDRRRLTDIAAATLLPGDSAEEQRDLGGFLAGVVADGSLPANVRNAANAAIEKLRQAVITNTDDLRDTSGLSVYLPVSNLNVLVIDPSKVSHYPTEFGEFATKASWLSLLNSLQEAADGRVTEEDTYDKGPANNDALNQATVLKPFGAGGIAESGLNLHNADDDDWFKFRVPAGGGTLQADITVARGEPLNVELRDENNNLLPAVYANQRLTFDLPPDARDYHLVFSSFKEIGSYSFVIQPPALPVDLSGNNNSPAKATDLKGTSFNGFAVDGAVAGVPAQEWLTFATTTTQEPRPRRVLLTVLNGRRLEAQLRDSSGFVVSSASGPGTLMLPYAPSGSAETFTLVILNPDAGQAFYNLSLENGTEVGAAYPLELFDTQGPFVTSARWQVSGPMTVADGRVTVDGLNSKDTAIYQSLRRADASPGDAGVETRFILGSKDKQVVAALARVNLTAGKVNAYEARLEYFKRTTTAVIYRTVNGVSSKLAFAAGPKLSAGSNVAGAMPTPGSEGILRLEVQGTFLRLLYNGVPYVEFTDSFSLPSGQTGFAGTPGVSFADFQAGALVRSLPYGYLPAGPGLGASWRPLSGEFAAPEDGRLVAGPGPASALYNPVRIADVLVTAKYTLANPNQSVSVIARHDGAAKATYYEAKVLRKADGSADAMLVRYVKGAAKILKAYPGVPTAATLGLEIRGNVLALLINGVAKPERVTDKSMPLAGRAGLSAAPGLSVENFAIIPLSARFADLFNRADGPLTGPDWSVKSGSLAVSGSRLTAGTDSVAVASPLTTADASVSARIDFSITAPQTVGLIARYSAAGSYYEGRLARGNDGAIIASIQRVGSNPKQLKSLKFTKASAGVLTFTVEGSTLTLSLLGESVTVTDTVLTGEGQTGLHLGPGATADDFTVR